MLRRVAVGESWLQIGRALGLTLGGVGSLNKQVLQKLGASTAAHAVHLAQSRGLLKPAAWVDMPAALVEVLELVADGSTNAEVGQQMGRSEYWAAEQVRDIRRRLGARDRAHAVALAIGGGLIQPPRPVQNAA
jgi:DNA-binding NarL/FixJ family response regulator